MTQTPWNEFRAWCAAHGERPEPPDWTTIVHHIRSLAEDRRRSPAGIRERVEELGAAYRRRNLEDPTSHERVQRELDGLADASTSPTLRRDPGLEKRNTASQGISQVAALPPVLLGHETPQVAQACSRFFASVAAMFEAWLARRRSPNTRRAYRRDVMDFVEFLGIRWPGDAHELLRVTVPQVQAWRDFLAEKRHAAPNTLNRRVSSVSGFYRFMREAAAEARLPVTIPNPAHSQFISREAQAPVTPTEALTATRARQLMSLPEGEEVLAYRDRAILKFYLYTGARIATGCRLKVEDFVDNEEDPKVRLQEKGRGTSKRALGINAIAADAFREYIARAGLTSGPLFRPRLNARSTKLAPRAMDISTMFRLLQEYLERVPRAMREHELPDGSQERRCLYSPHSLRATTATLLLDAGEDIRAVQELLGHKHVTVTQVYDKRRRGTKDSASHRLAL